MIECLFFCTVDSDVDLKLWICAGFIIHLDAIYVLHFKQIHTPQPCLVNHSEFWFPEQKK